MKKYQAVITLDWADKKHDGRLQEQGKHYSESFRLSQTPEGIEQWVASLKKRYARGRLAVVLEQKRGALLSALLKYECFDIYPVNPATIASYRETFYPSGAKNDDSDAELMLDFFKRHQEKLRVWVADDEKTRKLSILVEHRRMLVDERKRIGNKLTSLLKCYYPQLLELFPKMGRRVVCEFILKYPSLEHAKKASKRELIQFFRAHRSGRQDMLQKRLSYLENTLALTEDRALIETSMLLATSLARQMLLLIESTEDYDKQIERLFSTHHEAALFCSLPAAGESMAPRLLAAIGTDRTRFSSANELQCFLGIAPVLEESGTKSWTHWRYNCSKFVRQSVHEWAGISIQHSLWARAYYAMQRAKGKEHNIAIRALAYKWTRIIFKLWKTNSTYCEATYLNALQRSGSPIIKFMAENPNLEKLKFSNC